MALHGDIRANDRVIATWAAVRIVDPNDPHPHTRNRDHQYTYKVYVRTPGRQPTTAQFEVRHCYHDGPVVLAAKVLDRAGLVMGR